MYVECGHLFEAAVQKHSGDLYKIYVLTSVCLNTVMDGWINSLHMESVQDMLAGRFFNLEPASHFYCS